MRSGVSVIDWTARASADRDCAQVNGGIGGPEEASWATCHLTENAMPSPEATDGLYAAHDTIIPEFGLECWMKNRCSMNVREVIRALEANSFQVRPGVRRHFATETTPHIPPNPERAGMVFMDPDPVSCRWGDVPRVLSLHAPG